MLEDRPESPLDVAATKLLEWRRDPVAFVREVFGVEPDWWQAEALRYVARPGRKRLSMQACVGPGKSAVLAWIAWWFLVCFGEGREHPQGAAVSITQDNLVDGLWKELAKWQQVSPLLMQHFTWTSERVASKAHPRTWFLSARSWPKTANEDEQGRTLSGLHSQFILLLIDEAGEIPVAVKKAAEQALSNCTWGCIAIAGNPTSTAGILYAAATVERADWHVLEINGDPDNPQRASRVDIEWARSMIVRYGRDDPWVQSQILGRFPREAFNQLLTLEEVQAAMKRSPAEHEFSHAARVLGVDVAREGLNRSVVFPRQGLMAFQPLEARGLDGIQGASLVARKWQAWGAHACFIDAGGGYGASWIDQLRQLGFDPIGVKGSERSADPQYFNRRAAMLWAVRVWVKEGGALPNVPELVAQCTKQTYTFHRDQIRMTEKEKVAVALKGQSTDHLDALGFTFADPVIPPKLPGVPHPGDFGGGGHGGIGQAQRVDPRGGDAWARRLRAAA